MRTKTSVPLAVGPVAFNVFSNVLIAGPFIGVSIRSVLFRVHQKFLWTHSEIKHGQVLRSCKICI